MENEARVQLKRASEPHISQYILMSLPGKKQIIIVD